MEAFAVKGSKVNESMSMNIQAATGCVRLLLVTVVNFTLQASLCTTQLLLHTYPRLGGGIIYNVSRIAAQRTEAPEVVARQRVDDICKAQCGHHGQKAGC